jgi:hypothetical protein
MKSLLFTGFLFRKKKRINFYAKKPRLGETQNLNYSFISLIFKSYFLNILNCVGILHLCQPVHKEESTHTTNRSVPQKLTSQFQPWDKASTPELFRRPQPIYITVSCLKLWGRRRQYPEDRSSTFYSQYSWVSFLKSLVDVFLLCVHSVCPEHSAVNVEWLHWNCSL